MTERWSVLTLVMKVGGILKKIISILLVLCLSGCTVLDFVTDDNQNQTINSYKNDYKDTNTTTENQTQNKNGFTVKNKEDKNQTSNNQLKNGFQTVDKNKLNTKSLYLYYYDQLSSTQKAIYGELYDVLQKPVSEYSFKKLVKKEDFATALLAFNYDFPEAYWMWDYRYWLDDHGKVTKVKFQVPENYAETQAQVDQIVDNVVGAVANASDYEKIKYFYDWIINWTIYEDNECDQYYTSVFLYRKSICAGYSRAFQYLCKKAGIKCATVRGQTDEAHAWNFVELNGKYYWVDVTWGDPVNDDGSQSLVYYYFMVPDEVLFRTHYSLNGTGVIGDSSFEAFKFPKCTDNSLSYYVQNGAYFQTYDYYAIRDYVLQKLYEDPYQKISFQIGDQASFQVAVEQLLSQNYRYITNIFSEYFPGRYWYNAITKDDVGVITVQIVS